MQAEDPTQTLETIWVSDEQVPKPKVNANYIRLYGHMNCPFVERVRMSLGAKGIKYQRVEVDLGKKTQWHKDINGGLVPFLEFPNGEIVQSSELIVDLLEERYPD